SFSVNPLKIDGFVKHTPKWEEIHNQKKHPTSYFYSGEKFVLSANVTDHPIEYVIVNFKGIQKNGVELNINQALSGNNPIYNGEIFDTKMSEPTTSLENGNAYFLFTAKWKNGTIKQDLVTIQIIDNVYGVFDFYRSN
ncbi:peptidase, partial [Heyndrickxia sporothermodurans]